MADPTTAARAVLSAYDSAPFSDDLGDRAALAAAIRVATDQALPMPPLPLDSCCDVLLMRARARLLTIANEVEKTNG
jgi:hypothetical protein